jgi:hypothetical protein
MAWLEAYVWDTEAVFNNEGACESSVLARHSRVQSAKTCRIESHKLFLWQMDDDPMRATDALDISVLPRYSDVVVPET